MRLGVMWEAVEREEGVYDETYLDRIEALVKKLGENGIYVLLDAHQDAFARDSCGEGVPDFYGKEATKHPHCISYLADKVLEPVYKKMGVCADMRDFGYQVDENGDYLLADCETRGFGDYYYTKQGVSQFGALFTNEYGLNDKLIAFWDKVASRFESNPYVVGFDPLNEPYPANNVRDLTLNIPGVMDRKHLDPTYAAIYDKWTSHDPNAKMWFEPT